MTADQKNFYDFMMQRMQEDKKEEAKALLMENFRMQDEGTFTQEEMRKSMPQLLAYIKPEHIPELQQAAAHMSATMEK